MFDERTADQRASSKVVTRVRGWKYIVRELVIVRDPLNRADGQITKTVSHAHVAKGSVVGGGMHSTDLQYLTIVEQQLRHDVAARGASFRCGNWYWHYLVMGHAVNKIPDLKLTNGARSAGRGNRRIWVGTHA